MKKLKIKMGALLLLLLSFGFNAKMYAQPGPCLCLGTNGYEIINHQTNPVTVHYEVVDFNCSVAGSTCGGGCTIAAGGTLTIPPSGFNNNAFDIYIRVTEVNGVTTSNPRSVNGCPSPNCNNNTTHFSQIGTPVFTINWFCNYADIW